MIKTVKRLKVGDLFFHEGNLFTVTSFPTRAMVCGSLVKDYMFNAPGNIKIPIRKVIHSSAREALR